MAKQLKELKAKSKWKHQQVIDVKFIVDVKNKRGEIIAAKGSKHSVGLKAAEELIKLKRAEKV